MKKIKEKISNFLEDIKFSFRYKKGDIKFFFEGLRRWIEYYKVLSKVFDFDYTSILALEKHQIIRIHNYLIKHCRHIDYEDDLEKINLALRLLNIIEEDGCSELLDINLRDDNAKWAIPVYVNTKNALRFMSEDALERVNDPKIGPLIKDALRVEKAWYLYHKLRVNYLRNWWD